MYFRNDKQKEEKMSNGHRGTKPNRSTMAEIFDYESLRWWTRSGSAKRLPIR